MKFCNKFFGFFCVFLCWSTFTNAIVDQDDNNYDFDEEELVIFREEDLFNEALPQNDADLLIRLRIRLNRQIILNRAIAANEFNNVRHL